MEVRSLDKKNDYLYSVQRFLDLIDNVEDIDLKNDIRNAYFSSLRAICKVANFDLDSFIESGKN